MDTSDIVAGAVHDAESGIVSESPEPAESGGEKTVVDIGGEAEEGGGDAAGTAASPSSAAKVEGKSGLAAKVEQTPKPDEEMIKELASYGIHPPKPGQREGVFRWSKVQKVLENTRKKAAEKYEKDIRERDERIRQHEMRAKNEEAANRLIATDAQRYLEVLSTLHPEYKRFLPSAAAETKPKVEVSPKTEPPPPDAQFADGSLGYSPEGLDKLMQWHHNEAKREAMEAVKQEYETRFGPMEKDWKQSLEARAADRHLQEAIPIVRDQIANAKKVWGSMFKSKFTGDAEDDPEIVKALADHPDWSFEACVSSVLAPRMQTSRQTMREELLDEIHKAPAAASRSVPGTGGGGGKGAARTTTDIVTEAVRAAGG